jgi:hypothetical protein
MRSTGSEDFRMLTPRHLRTAGFVLFLCAIIAWLAEKFEISNSVIDLSVKYFMFGSIVFFLLEWGYRYYKPLSPDIVSAPDEKVKAAMELLKSKADRLGPPKTEGMDTVAGKQVPAIYFGSSKQNNDFALVDEVVKQAGGTATIFVKSGDEFVRVATNVRKDDGSRAIGTILDSKGKAIVAIRKGEAFYGGDVDILGKRYTTGYEPIRDGTKTVIGIYYVGYLK